MTTTTRGETRTGTARDGDLRASRASTAFRAAAAGLVATAAFFLAGQVLARWLLADCDDFGCAIFGGYAALVAAFVLAAVAGGATLRALHTRPFAAIAIAGTATTAALWPVVIAAMSRSPRWLLLGLVFVAAYVGHGLLLAPRNEWLFLVSVLVTGLSFLVIRPLAGPVADARYEREVRRDAGRVAFDVFLPRTPPPTYRLFRTEFSERSVGWHDHFVLRFATSESGTFYGHRMLTMRQFAMQDTFRPPRDCGTGEASTEPFPSPVPCARMGALPTGEPVYRGTVRVTGEVVFYVRKGGTLVTLTADFDLDRGQVLRMFGSLEPTTPEALVARE